MRQKPSIIALAALTLLVSVAFGGLAAPTVAADEECTTVQSLFGSCDEANDDGWLSSIGSFASGVVDRYTDKSDREAQASADDVQRFFNDHSAEFVAYANARTVGDADHDVVRITFEQDGERVHKYLVYGVDSSGNLTGAEIVDSTARAVDTNIVLEDNAAGNAADELEYFYEEFVSEDRTPKRSYLQHLAGEYGGLVDGELVEEFSG